MESTETMNTQATPEVAIQETPAAVTATEREKKAKIVTDMDNQTVTWNFADGGQTTLALSELKPEVVIWLALHGLKQKGSDVYSGKCTPEQARGLNQKVLDNLRIGETSDKGGPSPEDSVALLVTAYRNALVAHNLAEPDGWEAEIRGADKKGRAAYRAIPAVAFELAKLKQPATPTKTGLAAIFG